MFYPVAKPIISNEELQNVTDAVKSTWISSTGKYIDEFEEKFAAFCGTKYASSTSNGTVSLHLALVTLGIGPGDEVILPNLTFAATINTVLLTGATPVVVDVEEETWGICPEEVKKAITPKTKAIIAVHLYGQPCQIDLIKTIADENNLLLVEDCAQAHGASVNGKKIGSYGAINSFSFYGNKIMTTGEGGICTTDSEELVDTLKILKSHGMSKEKRYWHDSVAFNYRMTNLQAAIGVAQIDRIDSILRERRACEDEYRAVLGDISSIEFQRDIPGHSRVTWLVSFLTPNRDALAEKLKELGIDSRPFFYPLTDMPVYQAYKFSDTVSKRLSERGINLPTYSESEELRPVFNLLADHKSELKSLIEGKS